MPKIEVYADALFRYAGKKYSDDALEAIFPCAKAELDGKDEAEGLLKVELNDTNRPDLWSTAGLGRQLRVYEGGQSSSYDFFSTKKKSLDNGGRVVEVDASVKDIRPYLVAFAVEGKGISEAELKDIIQTQEKLCWNFGRKRKSIAMGVYRSDLFQYPVQYKAVDPDKTRFVPLQMEDRAMSLREIIKDHPKGQEFGHIVKDKTLFPFITDAQDKVLSFPPVINSAEIGAVQEGDKNLFIELTGTELHDLVLTASIVACDLADAGLKVLPVTVKYPWETELGREITLPYYFQEPLKVSADAARKLLGEKLSLSEMEAALKRMGVEAAGAGSGEAEELTITVPPYRNDFLHPVDVMEDIMIGRGLDSFEPMMPGDYTIGRLTPAEELIRRARDIMVGLGFQEMMYNYLGSRKDYIEKMAVSGDDLIQIANPMTENYEYVRNSILPALLHSESISANAVYPHHICEMGKTAYLKEETNSGTETANFLGFLSADRDAGFNQINSHVSALFYYLGRDYELKELRDPRVIDGRGAEIWVGGQRAGFFGEVHPQVLENWGIQMPTVVCEINLDTLL